MTDPAQIIKAISDTDGLAAICSASANIKAVLVGLLSTGEIAVPTCVCQEFTELYPTDAEEIMPAISNKIKMSKEIKIGAAHLADKLNSGFPRGPYDTSVELFSAAIASSYDVPVLTSKSQGSVYVKMKVGSIMIDDLVDI